MPKGGARDGAGRPSVGGKIRKQRQLRLSDDEWEIVKAFDKILKYGDYFAAKDFVESHKIQKS